MKEISAGGVVYRREGGRLFIQLIEDRFGKVTLAKGKQEPGETLEETALREIREETGIAGRLEKPIETVRYQYHHPVLNIPVDKEVHYYLVEAVDDELTAQAEEIRDVHWYSPQEALRLQAEKGYDNNDGVLRKALSLLGES